MNVAELLENISFTSTAFCWFLALFLLAYFATRARARLWVCLAGSYIFYAGADPIAPALLFGATATDYALGLLAGRARAAGDDRGRRRAVLVSVMINLGLLAVCKYFNFFIGSVSELLAQIGLGTSWRALELILPLGLSFYTFRKISYVVDVARGEVEAETSFLRFAVFVSIFPQLVAGPIVRAGLLLPQLRRDRQPDATDVARGLLLAAWGYFLKLGVANSVAVVADRVLVTEGVSGAPAIFDHRGLGLGVAVLFYTVQIYGDFAGYSYIAIGLARIMGFDFGVNFDRPYFSADFSEFWRRWHISLSSWLRDYLYIPLGGNRRGALTDRKSTRLNSSHYS